MTNAPTPDIAVAKALGVQLKMILKLTAEVQFSVECIVDNLTRLPQDLDSLKEALEALRWKPFIDAGVPPAACVPIQDYREEDYRYFDDISHDPLWGLDADHDWSDDERCFDILYADKLGWNIRTTPRTSEGLKKLNRMRDWHIQCRAFGLDPLAPDADKTLEEFGVYQDVLAQVHTDKERATAKATFEQVMRDVVAKDAAYFAQGLEDRARLGRLYPWPSFDHYAVRRAQWAKAPETGAAE